MNRREAAKKAILKISKWTKLEEASNANRVEIEVQRDELEKYWQEFEEAHNSVLCVCGPGEVSMQNIEYCSVEPEYVSARESCEALLVALAEKESSSSCSTSSNELSARAVVKRNSAAARISKHAEEVVTWTKHSTTQQGVSAQLELLEQDWT